MEKFEDLKKDFNDYIAEVEKRDQIAHNFTRLPQKDIAMFCSALTDICDNVKHPNNRTIVLQEILDGGKIELNSETNVISALKIRAIMAGVLQNVDSKEVLKFAGTGPIEYMRYLCVVDTLQREEAGVDLASIDKGK